MKKLIALIIASQEANKDDIGKTSRAKAEKIAQRVILAQQALVNKLELGLLDREGVAEEQERKLFAGTGDVQTLHDARIQLEAHKVGLEAARATLGSWAADVA